MNTLPRRLVLGLTAVPGLGIGVWAFAFPAGFFDRVGQVVALVIAAALGLVLVAPSRRRIGAVR